MRDANFGGGRATTAEAATKLALARLRIEEALLVLADAGVMPAATHLNAALACIGAVPDAQSGRDADCPTIGPDPILVRAIGGALAVVGTVLARDDLLPLAELGSLLGQFASVTEHHDPAVGLILANWSGMILDAAAEMERPQVD
ncbi:hypothetical protein [Sphingomonas carotinifaciens]|uniref:Uncharacterized protein n=1 Tax=Sphingomonas carotinifaciens TaxID=1166323 RepID=A0A1G7PWM0_9SPHN|nr:hypothetical protein [Sphingomonas carotinifaciens]MBB4087541.1 hypothetical protein [Sphingomonas carotinifaciens]MWC45628.1 hypothetical protein [Sphingomonas carotinifaciens]SDF90643.1 hypothetical protein SAMN05216557_107115 [Sphingomonas carotinifaciens]